MIASSGCAACSAAMPFAIAAAPSPVSPVTAMRSTPLRAGIAISGRVGALAEMAIAKIVTTRRRIFDSVTHMRKLVLLLFVSATPLFAAKSWETFDYAKQPLTEAAVAERTLDELRLMRGIVFGRHGRIFSADRDIDRYLRAQSWYKPDAYYLMTMELTAVETANLDVIRG